MHTHLQPPSPFLDPGTHASANTLGILQLRRDQLIPAVLCPHGESDYAEGKVENTRFGSFPHSTLVGQPWGTQILASVVDTGSRGKSKKRKRDATDEGADWEEKDHIGSTEARHDGAKPQEEPDNFKSQEKRDIVKAAAASSGFAHLIPPTPEFWTLSLPHRTQVVYTPDYSYVLQRLRVRPGDHMIEAGAGSGSFTHASVRAVFNRYPATADAVNGAQDKDSSTHDKDSRRRHRRRPERHGAVYSFEYHAPRAEQLRLEIKEHGLDALVTITHRDVYADGFCLDDGAGPDADAIFLDLPAPWQALRHLTRSPPSTPDSVPTGDPPPFRSPLNPKKAVRICTFSPCIEQVTKTVAALRSYGWVDIDMAEVQHKRLEVRRERVGLVEEGSRGGNATAATVQEAVQRLRDVEGRAHIFHSLQKEKQEEMMRNAEARKRAGKAGADEEKDKKHPALDRLPPSKHDRLAQSKKEQENRVLYKEGRLIHRTEPEIKTHTSYLVFAVLPRQWTKEDEEKAKTRTWKRQA